ncbi:MAG: kynureninase [Gemmatimonadota bacterium]|nr:kynureninase [Gemmatimonadota bacterium]
MLKKTDAGVALKLDEGDPLSDYRDRFYFDEEEITYFDGNSLGRLPKATIALGHDLIQRQWGQCLLRSWTDDWMALSARIGDKIAQLVGADKGEVLVADSTSVVLYKLVVAARQAQTGRSGIVTDDMNFPSDLYIIQAAAQLVNSHHTIKMVGSDNDITIPSKEIVETIDDDTALVVLSHVSFKSSYVYDMARITQKAHEHGALVLWDVSHSAGALPIDFTACSVDLGVGCSYKYLNGGPGAPAFLYIRKMHQSGLFNPISGWFGHHSPFDFVKNYKPAGTIDRFLTGTPPVISIALIEPGVDLILEAGIENIRQKSVNQTDYLITLWDAGLADLGFVLKTPRESDVRGSHISFGHIDGHRINRALRDYYSIYTDFRAPDNLRIGITPLYMTYQDIHKVFSAMQEIVVKKLYEKYPEVSERVII